MSDIDLGQTLRTVLASLQAAVTVLEAIVIPSPITISGTPPTTGTVGVPYNFVPTTSNGSGTKTFSKNIALLAGMTFSTSTGAVGGTPSEAGTLTGLVITCTDSTGSASTVPKNVTIAEAGSTSGQWFANSTDIFANGTDWFADGTKTGGSGGIGNPALTLTGPATISEGDPSAAAPALTLSGPATLTEGNPTGPALTLSGPTTLTEGN